MPGFADKDSLMVVNTNTTAARGARFLADSTTNLQKSLARLSSGSKIVEPQDDAAGLAVASKFDAQINRTQAIRANIGNAISYKQTQDGFLSKVATALDRMSELATFAQDETKSSSDLALYQQEFSTLQDYVGLIKDQTFNGVSLFASTGIDVMQQDDSTKFSTTGIDLAANATSISSLSLGSASAATSAMSTLKTEISNIATHRAGVGADLSRLTKTNDHLAVLSENLSASVSRIKDVDVAEESARYAKYNILVQSGTAMLAQANSLPQTALRLLS